MQKIIVQIRLGIEKRLNFKKTNNIQMIHSMSSTRERSRLPMSAVHLLLPTPTPFSVDFIHQQVFLPAFSNFDEKSQCVSSSLVSLSRKTVAPICRLVKRFPESGYLEVKPGGESRLKYGTIHGRRGSLFSERPSITCSQTERKSDEGRFRSSGIQVDVELRPILKKFSVSYEIQFAGKNWLCSLAEYLGLKNPRMSELIAGILESWFKLSIGPKEIESQFRPQRYVIRKYSKGIFPISNDPSVRSVMILAGDQSKGVGVHNLNWDVDDPIGASIGLLIAQSEEGLPGDPFVRFAVSLRENVLGPVPLPFSDLWNYLYSPER